MTTDLQRVARIIATIQQTTGERRLRWSTKLWNAIDYFDLPEELWELMLEQLPDAFYARCVNCMRFTY